MKVSEKRMAVLRDHIRAESEHDMQALLAGMTSDCFNDVVGVAEPFVGPEQTAERYRNHWKGFPDFTVRVRRILCSDEFSWCRYGKRMARYPSWHLPGLASDRKAGSHAGDCRLAFQRR